MPKSFQKGISLVEIILAILVIGFIVLLITSLPNSLRLVGGSKNETIAKDIVSKKIEGLRSLGYGNFASGPIIDPRTNELPSGSGDVLVEDCPITICTNNEEIKKVAVKVSWSDQGNTKKVEVITFIGKGGLR